MAHRTHMGLLGYLAVWAGLLVLTLLTFGLSYVHLGDWGMPIALVIASSKGLLVALFFMHLVEQNATNRIVAAVGVVFVALLLGLMLVDTTIRAPSEAPKLMSTEVEY